MRKPEHRLAGVAAHIAAFVIQRCEGLRMDVAPLIAPAQRAPARREPARGLERSNRRCQMWTSDTASADSTAVRAALPGDSQIRTIIDDRLCWIGCSGRDCEAAAIAGPMSDNGPA